MPSTEFEPRSVRRARERALKKSPQPPKRRPVFFVAGVVVALGLGFGIWKLAHTSISTTKNTNTAVARADQALLDSCTTDTATTFHIHAHLTVIVDGKNEIIPANTAISPNCMHAMHTHDETGVVHIESPVQKNFALADWFYLWGKQWSITDFFGQPLDADHQLKVFVDGHEVTTGAATLFRDQTSFVILYDKKSATVTPPANYQFPANL